MTGWGGSWGGYWGGGIPPTDLRVVGAVAVTPYLARVEFSLPLDLGTPENSDPANYNIPGLVVSGVTLSGVYAYLTTSLQAAILYTVTVTEAVSIYGALLNPAYRTATFTGLSEGAPIYVVATGENRIRLFCPTERILNTASLTNPANYRLLEKHQHGVEVTLVSVVPEVTGNPYSVVLEPATPLKNTAWYSLEVLASDLRTITGKNLVPSNHIFQWVADDALTTVGFNLFSGEVEGGLLGTPAGVIYFSPALDQAVDGSFIQVEEVSVCTRAYDVYTFPVPVDPIPLFTFSPTLAVSQVGLNNTVVWGSPFRLGETRIDLHDHQSDTVPLAVDGRCVVEVKEPWDPDYVALLNNPAWHLYDGTPRTFICADNLAPIPPGPDTTIVLVP